MTLSKEQRRKISERLDWLLEDQDFRRKLQGNQLSTGEAISVVTWALERFEEEKVAITGNGRYQAQCEELVSNADAFFGNYTQELRQLSVSWFRFANRVLEDHLGEENGLRVLTIGKGQIMTALVAALNVIRLLVFDHTRS